MDYSTTKPRVMLPHGPTAVAVPTYNIGYSIGPDGRGQPGDRIGYTITRNGKPQHADVGFVVVPRP